MPTLSSLLSETLIVLIYYAFKGGEEENSDAIAPTFIEKPKIVPNESGTLITMKCKCRAKPAPVVTWFKESTQVTESSRFKMKCTAIESDVYELVLEIKVRNSALDFLNSTKFYSLEEIGRFRILLKLMVDLTSATSRMTTASRMPSSI